jgi:hypothetical protein
MDSDVESEDERMSIIAKMLAPVTDAHLRTSDIRTFLVCLGSRWRLSLEGRTAATA